MAKLQSVNPSNYRVLGGVDISTPYDVTEAVRSARRAQKEWGDLELTHRIRLLKNVVAEFRNRKKDIALLASREMGMPIGETTAVDFDGGLEFADWYLDNAEKHLNPENTLNNETDINRVFREPIGVHAAIVPWNYPVLNFIWSSFQSLIAGNAVVFKHSEECPLSCMVIEEVVSLHLPKGVFTAVYGAGDVGEVLTNQDINMIGFVGSTRTGKALYEKAGKKFIRMLAEMGGSAPGIIFEDADVEAAIASVCEYRLGNGGQWCDGLKRLIVHERIFNQVVEGIAAVFSSKKLGVAEEADTEIGPLVSQRQLKLIASQVDDARDKGATIVAGGKSREKEMGGAFYQPTLITNVEPRMRVWREETFGPVLPIVKFTNEETAVIMANDTDYGLGGYVYTGDPERAQRVARRLQTGMVSINGANYTCPWNPFGGYKNSGMGREHGKFGFHEVTQVKVVAWQK